MAFAARQARDFSTLNSRSKILDAVLAQGGLYLLALQQKGNPGPMHWLTFDTRGRAGWMYFFDPLVGEFRFPASKTAQFRIFYDAFYGDLYKARFHRGMRSSPLSERVAMEMRFETSSGRQARRTT